MTLSFPHLGLGLEVESGSEEGEQRELCLLTRPGSVPSPVNLVLAPALCTGYRSVGYTKSCYPGLVFGVLGGDLLQEWLHSTLALSSSVIPLCPQDKGFRKDRITRSHLPPEPTLRPVGTRRTHMPSLFGNRNSN